MGWIKLGTALSIVSLILGFASSFVGEKVLDFKIAQAIDARTKS